MRSPFAPRPGAFLVAIALDAALGDPPTALHPVGWIGRLARLVERAVDRGVPDTPRARRRAGRAAAVALPLLAALAGRALGGRVPGGRPRAGLVSMLREAAVLDATFALRTLLHRAAEVRDALDAGDLEAARTLLATHLVSRDTSDLRSAEVAGAAIESVAENLGDGVLGPWLAYAALGLPGAYAYRAVNTLDSMWGYRTPRYLDFGRAAARIDDAANLVPARAAAAAIVAAAALIEADAGGAIEAWRRDARRTDSPNAGHPMAAMAGALGVVLEKRGAYRLGAPGREPVAADITRAIAIARVAAALSAAVLTAAVLAASMCRARGDAR